MDNLTQLYSLFFMLSKALVLVLESSGNLAAAPKDGLIVSTLS